MKTFAPILLVALLAGCSPVDEPPQDLVNDDTLRKEPQMPVPAFQIQIALSEKATQKMSAAKETIKGFVEFDGDGN
jgi:hypothetical protein